MNKKAQPNSLVRWVLMRNILFVLLGVLLGVFIISTLFWPFVSKYTSSFLIESLQKRINGRLEYKNVTVNKYSFTINDVAIWGKNDSEPVFQAKSISVSNLNKLFKNEVNIDLEQGNLLVTRDQDGKTNIQNLFKKITKPSQNQWNIHITIKNSNLVYSDKTRLIPENKRFNIPTHWQSRLGLSNNNKFEFKPFELNTTNLEGNIKVITNQNIIVNLKANIKDNNNSNILGTLQLKGNIPTNKNNKAFDIRLTLKKLNANVLLPIIHQAMPALQQAEIVSTDNNLTLEWRKNNKEQVSYKLLSNIIFNKIVLPNKPAFGPININVRYDSINPQNARIEFNSNFDSNYNNINIELKDFSNVDKIRLYANLNKLPLKKIKSFIPELNKLPIVAESVSGQLTLNGLKNKNGKGFIQINNLSYKNVLVNTLKSYFSINNETIVLSNITANSPELKFSGSGTIQEDLRNANILVNTLQIAPSLINNQLNSNIKIKNTVSFKGNIGIKNNQFYTNGSLTNLGLTSGGWSLNDFKSDIIINNKQVSLNNFSANTTFQSKMLNWAQRRFAIPDLAIINGSLLVKIDPLGNFNLEYGAGQVHFKSTYASPFDIKPTFGKGVWTLHFKDNNTSYLLLKAPINYRDKLVSLDLAAYLRNRGLSNAKLVLKRDIFNAEIRTQFDLKKPQPSGGFIIKELDLERLMPSFNLSGLVSSYGSFNMDGKFFNINGSLLSDSLQFNKSFNNHKIEPIKNLNLVFDYKSEKTNFYSTSMTFKGLPIVIKGILEPNFLNMNLQIPNLSIYKIVSCLVDLKICEVCTLDNLSLKGNGNLDIDIKGNFVKSLLTIKYLPNNLEVKNTHFDNVKLLAHTYLSLEKRIPPDFIELDSLEISGNHGSLTAKGLIPIISSGKLQIKSELNDFNIDFLSTFLPKLGITRAKIATLEKNKMPITNLDDYHGPPPLTGKLNGYLNLSGTFRKPSGSAQLSLDQGSIFAYQLKNGIVDLILTDKGLQINKLQIEVDDALIEGNGLLAKNIAESVFNIHTTAFNLAVLQPFIGYKIKGTIELDITKQPNTSGMIGNIIGNQLIIAGIGFRTAAVKFETIGTDYLRIISANLRPQPLNNDLALGTIQLAGKVPLGLDNNVVDSNGNPLNLDLSIKIPQIKLEQLLALYPKLNIKGTGEIFGEGKITGTYDNLYPDIQLQGSLNNINLPSGLELSAVQMNAHLGYKEFNFEFFPTENDNKKLSSLTIENQIIGAGSSSSNKAVLFATGKYNFYPPKLYSLNAVFNPENIEMIRINNLINGRMTGKININLDSQTEQIKLTGYSTIKSGSILYVSPLAAGFAIDSKLPKLDLNVSITIEKGCSMKFSPINFHSGLYGKIKFEGSTSNLQASGNLFMKGGGFELYRQRFRFVDEVEAARISFSSIDGLMPRITAKASTVVRQPSSTGGDNSLIVYITMNQTRLDQLNEATLTSEPPRGKDTIIAALTGNLTSLPNKINLIDSVLRDELIAYSMSKLSSEIEDLLNLDKFEFYWYNDKSYFVDIEKQIYKNLYLSYTRSLSKDWLNPEELIGLRYSLLKQGSFNLSGIAKYDINKNTLEGHRVGLQLTHRFDSPLARGENLPATPSEKHINLNPFNFDYKLNILKPTEDKKPTTTTTDSSYTNISRPSNPFNIAIKSYPNSQVFEEQERYSPN